MRYIRARLKAVRVFVPAPAVSDLSGALAQLVEHLTFNQVVAGSNPARPTIQINELRLD